MLSRASPHIKDRRRSQHTQSACSSGTRVEQQQHQRVTSCHAGGRQPHPRDAQQDAAAAGAAAAAAALSRRQLLGTAGLLVAAGSWLAQQQPVLALLDTPEGFRAQVDRCVASAGSAGSAARHQQSKGERGGRGASPRSNPPRVLPPCSGCRLGVRRAMGPLPRRARWHASPTPRHAPPRHATHHTTHHTTHHHGTAHRHAAHHGTAHRHGTAPPGSTATRSSTRSSGRP
jgi:hypothetical protein